MVVFHRVSFDPFTDVQVFRLDDEIPYRDAANQLIAQAAGGLSPELAVRRDCMERRLRAGLDRRRPLGRDGVFLTTPTGR